MCSSRLLYLVRPKTLPLAAPALRIPPSAVVLHANALPSHTARPCLPFRNRAEKTCGPDLEKAPSDW
eukprot:COSAG06_NODE_4615_length_4098_cov_26.920980_6_plen_66_part_01